MFCFTVIISLYVILLPTRQARFTGIRYGARHFDRAIDARAPTQKCLLQDADAPSMFLPREVARCNAKGGRCPLQSSIASSATMRFRVLRNSGCEMITRRGARHCEDARDDGISCLVRRRRMPRVMLAAPALLPDESVSSVRREMPEREDVSCSGSRLPLSAMSRQMFTTARCFAAAHDSPLPADDRQTSDSTFRLFFLPPLR